MFQQEVAQPSLVTIARSKGDAAERNVGWPDQDDVLIHADISPKRPDRRNWNALPNRRSDARQGVFT